MASRSFRLVPAVALVVDRDAVAAGAGAGSRTDQSAVDAASKRAAERIRALQRESDSLASQERTLLVELRKLEVDRELKSEELASAERDLRRTREQVAATSARAAALQNTAETERPDVERRLVASLQAWTRRLLAACCSTSTTFARSDASIAPPRR